MIHPRPGRRIAPVANCVFLFTVPKGGRMAEIGDPVREIEIVPREEPLPQELPVPEPVPERELEPA